MCRPFQLVVLCVTLKWVGWEVTLNKHISCVLFVKTRNIVYLYGHRSGAASNKSFGWSLVYDHE